MMRVCAENVTDRNFLFQCGHGGGASNCAVDVAELQATLQEREKDLQKLKDELKKLRDEQKIVTKVVTKVSLPLRPHLRFCFLLCKK